MQNLREKYPEFIFDSFEMQALPTGIFVEYLYKLGEHEFRPTVTIPIESVSNKEINNSFLHELFFNFGIINAISYYKLTCAPKFVIRAGQLDDTQKFFFRKLFYNGLGEFMFINNINIPFESFMTIECEEHPENEPTVEDGEDSPEEDNNSDFNPEESIKKPADRFNIGHNFHGNLITVGGGKDSVVALEALQPMHADNLCFQYNRDLYPENIAALSCIKLAGYSSEDTIDFNLTFDKHLLELNKEGYLNGHIPFSSTLAFATLIGAYLNNRKYIVLSNEASANEGNIFGTNINHQYSKSYEFEQDFQKYVAYYLTEEIYYFSILRCLNEFEIVQKFLKFPSYLKVFRSCNVGTKENKWCGHCAKCLYVYIMLYPFVDKAVLHEIFGHDLLDDETLTDTFNGLINPDLTKPFECVGTKAEICYSLDLAVQEKEIEGLPKLLKAYRKAGYNQFREYNIPTYYNPEHGIPEDYLKLILDL